MRLFAMFVVAPLISRGSLTFYSSAVDQ